MSRHHVHLSKDIPTAQTVGARHGKPVVFTVHTAAMHQAGRANASKLYLLTTEVKNQRKISISRLIYFHRFKAIA